ncbi:MAG: HU family DNA-binding protein [Planctomycetota bacterium]|jgi:DNA-binding protein HU-beta
MSVVRELDLVRRVAATTSQKQPVVRHTIRYFLEAIEAELAAGNVVKLTRFGTLTPHVQPGREHRHPGTGRACSIQAHRYVRFRAARELRRYLNEPPRLTDECSPIR